jgi:hypothetical protein
MGIEDVAALKLRATTPPWQKVGWLGTDDDTEKRKTLQP